MPRRAVFGLGVGLFLAAHLASSDSPRPSAGFLDAYPWSMPDPQFGGLSALEIAPDGLSVIALSDKGTFTTGVIRRDVAGRITGIDTTAPKGLQDETGATLPAGRNDTEGLALAADGSAFVSLEGPARVLFYQHLDGPALPLPDAAEFASLDDNKALEALAIAPDGAIYTLPEESEGDYPLLRLRNGVWDTAFHIAKSGNFLPVGADFGPDGRFYLLERQFRGLSGFASRIRRFDPDSRGTVAGEVLLQTAAGTHDNLEGLSIWRDGAGRLVASMVSDDNFLPVLATDLVEYHLPD